MSDFDDSVIDRSGITFDVATALRVEEHLQAMDYNVDPEYVPSAFALEFVVFIKLVNGAEGEENRRQHEIVGQSNHHDQILCFATTTAPTMATRSKTPVISKATNPVEEPAK